MRNANIENGAILMVTWQQVIDYLANEYKAFSQDGGNTLIVQFETSWGRSQLVYILGSDDRAHVTLFSPIGQVDQINAEHLLTLTGDALFGILREGNVYVVGHVIPLDTFDVGIFEQDMRKVAQQADQHEMALGLGDQM